MLNGYVFLQQNSDMFWKPALAVQADVGTFLVQLSKIVDDTKWDPNWLSTLQKRDQEKEIANQKVSLLIHSGR